MEATTADQVLLEQDLTIESSVDLPQRGEFVDCDQCGRRSYFFYVLNGARLLSYCYHHGNENHTNIMKLDPIFVDYSDDLKENRQKGHD